MVVQDKLQGYCRQNSHKIQNPTSFGSFLTQCQNGFFVVTPHNMMQTGNLFILTFLRL